MKIKIVLLTAIVMMSVLMVLDATIYLALNARFSAVTRANLTTNILSVSQLAPNNVNNGRLNLHRSDMSWLVQYIRDGQTAYFADAKGHIIRVVGETNLQSPKLPHFNAHRIVSSTINIGDQRYFYIASPIVAEDTHTFLGYVAMTEGIPSQTEFMRYLLIALIVGSISAVAVVAFAAYGIAVSVLNPLYRMMRTVSRIEADRIHERVPVLSRRDEVAQLAQAFNRMLDRIERSFQQQSRFVADASHEIRTPLTIIKGYANLLVRWGKDNPDMLNEGVTVIHREADRLHKMANDLLALSSAEITLRDESHSVDANVVISEVTNALSSLYDDKVVRLELSNIPLLKMTESHFKRVFLNVLDNALKYTPSGGHIEVSTFRQNESVVVEVVDSGPGMSEEVVQHIFQRFYRAPQASRDGEGGTGLGLAIVKELVSLYGGRVEVDSKPQLGTKIRILLPEVNRS